MVRQFFSVLWVPGNKKRGSGEQQQEVCISINQSKIWRVGLFLRREDNIKFIITILNKHSSVSKVSSISRAWEFDRIGCASCQILALHLIMQKGNCCVDLRYSDYQQWIPFVFKADSSYTVARCGSGILLTGRWQKHCTKNQCEQKKEIFFHIKSSLLQKYKDLFNIKM